jgi:multidrug efflux pump subunit AcrA (membrane-fusion protein)
MAPRLIQRLRSNKRRTQIFYAALVLAVAAVASFGLLSIFNTGGGAVSGIARTVTVQRGDVQASVSASGNISSANSESVSFGASGTVTSIKVTTGQSVKKGQVLATIDPTTAETALQSAQAQLAAATATLSAALAGGTPEQIAQTNSSLANAKMTLQSDEQQVEEDQQTVATAKAQLAADRQIGCPAVVATLSTNSGSASSASSSTTTTTATSIATGSGSRSSGLAIGLAAPTVVTGTASSISADSAVLSGSVTPNGQDTTYAVEYGTTSSFGLTSASADAGNGTTASSVTVQLNQLRPNTIYIYRIVATNAAGTSYGARQTFMTSAGTCDADETTLANDEANLAKATTQVNAQKDSITATEDAAVTTSATLAQDRASVASAQATVTSDEKAVSGTTLVAPIDGTVTAINGSVGESVTGSTNSSANANSSASSSSSNSFNSSASNSASSSSSSGFLTITDLGQLEVVADIAEADATKIKVGDDATVTLAALPSTEVPGKVVGVSLTASVVSNVVTYPVTVALVSPPSSVKDGMTADVSIVVASASNVLEVPSAAITTTGNTSTVTVLANGTRTTKQVTIGIVGSSTTQIVSGVNEGAVLVEPTATVNAASGTSGSGRAGFGGGFGGGGGGRLIFGGG